MHKRPAFPSIDTDILMQALQVAAAELVALESLRAELHEIGHQAAKKQRQRGASLHDAILNSMPDGCSIEGAVWSEIEKGLRTAWKVLGC